MKQPFGLTKFPVKSSAIRSELIREDKCPDCGGELDTGWECNSCGADFRAQARTLADRRSLLGAVKGGA